MCLGRSLMRPFNNPQLEVRTFRDIYIYLCRRRNWYKFVLMQHKGFNQIIENLTLFGQTAIPISIAAEHLDCREHAGVRTNGSNPNDVQQTCDRCHWGLVCRRWYGAGTHVRSQGHGHISTGMLRLFICLSCLFRTKIFSLKLKLWLGKNYDTGHYSWQHRNIEYQRRL